MERRVRSQPTGGQEILRNSKPVKPWSPGSREIDAGALVEEMRKIAKMRKVLKP